MRKLFYIVVLVIVSNLGFVSCDESDPVQYWYSFGTYIQNETSAAGYHFNLDSGAKLIPTNSGSVIGLDDSSRVIVTYSIQSEVGIGEDKIVNGDISTIEEILTKEIIQLTNENIDSIGSDPVFTTDYDIWLTEKHINLIFRYYGYNKTHYINLAKPIGSQVDEEGNQILELRHNKNDDIDVNLYESVVSFSMDSVYEQGMDSLKFVLVAVDGDTNNFKYYDTFYFNTNTMKSVPQANMYNVNLQIE